jgi:hypothetical protein
MLAGFITPSSTVNTLKKVMDIGVLAVFEIIRLPVLSRNGATPIEAFNLLFTYL